MGKRKNDGNAELERPQKRGRKGKKQQEEETKAEEKVEEKVQAQEEPAAAAPAAAAAPMETDAANGEEKQQSPAKRASGRSKGKAAAAAAEKKTPEKTPKKAAGRGKKQKEEPAAAAEAEAAPAAEVEEKKVVEKKKPAGRGKKQAAVVENKEEKQVTGFVMSFGSGDMAQLGLGPEKQERKFPAPIPELEKQQVVSVAAGALHSAAIIKTDKGTQVWTWGCNDDGALGRETDEWSAQPVTTGLDDAHVVQLTCGDCHTVALTQDGRVFSWGLFKDVHGALGFSQKVEKQTVPTELVVSRSANNQSPIVVMIASGEHHALALTATGQVFEWGDIRVGARKSDRSSTSRAKLQPRLVAFPSPKPKIVKVFASGATSFAVSDQGKVYAWGLNNFGQCGTGDYENLAKPTHVKGFDGLHVVKMAGGMHHTLALTADHKLYSCGKGVYGRLGHGKKEKEDHPDNEPVPRLIEALQQLPDNDYVVDVAAGEAHSIAITHKGKLYSWGFGDVLALGNGEEKDEIVPYLVKSKQLDEEGPRAVVAAAGGSQHSIILVRNL